MTQYDTAESAYWGFFESFNAKSASGRAAVMSYPHVRIWASQPVATVHETPEALEANASWAAVERAGWARTQPITPRVVHHSSDKVHFAGGWTRLRADESVINSSRLLYIASKIDGCWGIQCAFDVEGDLSGDDGVAQRSAAMTLLDRTMRTLERGQVDEWLECFHAPMTLILGPGQIETFDTREATDAAYRAWASDARPITHQSQVTAVGPSAALVEQSIQHGEDAFQQVFFMVERDGVWATVAVSAVRPED